MPVTAQNSTSTPWSHPWYTVHKVEPWLYTVTGVVLQLSRFAQARALAPLS